MGNCQERCQQVEARIDDSHHIAHQEGIGFTNLGGVLITDVNGGTELGHDRFRQAIDAYHDSRKGSRVCDGEHCVFAIDLERPEATATFLQQILAKRRN